MGQLTKLNKINLILLTHNFTTRVRSSPYIDVQWQSVSLFIQFLFSLWRKARKYHIWLFTHKTRMRRCWKQSMVYTSF